MLSFLDIKMTGYEPTDTLCSVAFLQDDKRVFEYINEGKKITPEASASHHITNAMIRDAKAFRESETLTLLEQLGSDETVVVHNYQLVEKVLHKSGLHLKCDIIDTQRLTKHLLEDCSRFDLNYLRYELQLDGIKNACYQAQDDVFVVRSLFEYLQEFYTLGEMKERSFAPVLLQKMSFGKYSGKYIEEILQSDPRYLEWVLSLDGLDEDLQYSIQHYFER